MKAYSHCHYLLKIVGSPGEQGNKGERGPAGWDKLNVDF